MTIHSCLSSRPPDVSPRRQTEKLLTKNNVLVDENNDLRRQLELSKQTEEELAKRNNVYQKTIKSLVGPGGR